MGSLYGYRFNLCSLEFNSLSLTLSDRECVLSRGGYLPALFTTASAQPERGRHTVGTEQLVTDGADVAASISGSPILSPSFMPRSVYCSPLPCLPGPEYRTEDPCSHSSFDTLATQQTPAPYSHVPLISPWFLGTQNSFALPLSHSPSHSQSSLSTSQTHHLPLWLRILSAPSPRLSPCISRRSLCGASQPGPARVAGPQMAMGHFSSSPGWLPWPGVTFPSPAAPSHRGFIS